MHKPILALILSLQMTFSAPLTTTLPAALSDAAQPARLWWGLIDPELSLWFSRLPLEEDADEPVLWDFSWRGFLAALFGQPMTKEAVSHAAQA